MYVYAYIFLCMCVCVCVCVYVCMLYIYNVGDLGLIPGLGRFLGEGNGYPLQYSGLKNFMGCIVHGLYCPWARTESDTTERISLAQKGMEKREPSYTVVDM